MTARDVFEWGAALATLGIGVCTVALALGMFRSIWKDWKD